MKTRYKFLIVIFIFIFIIIPNKTSAVTLGEYEALVRKYTSELEANSAELKKAEENILIAKNEINNATIEIGKIGEEIEQIQKDAVKYNEDIRKKSLQTKELFKYLQISSGENIYLEYVFGAENITDLIYRTSVVEQITKYNEKIIKELEDMIEANKQREIKIKQKQKELDSKRKELDLKVKALTNTKASIGQLIIDAESEKKYYENIVNNYKSLGCTTNDVIGVDCAKMNSAVGFYRPTETGYVTANYPAYPGGGYHAGMDIGSAYGKGTKIYPVANGRVAKVYQDGYGALIVVMHHYVASENKYYSSTYGHLSSFSSNAVVGKELTVNDYIGYMGNTGYVIPAPTPSNPNAGTHLHLEFAPCKAFDLSDPNCSNWSRYSSYLQRLANQGYTGARSKIWFPNGLYVTWYNR